MYLSRQRVMSREISLIRVIAFMFHLPELVKYVSKGCVK